MRLIRSLRFVPSPSSFSRRSSSLCNVIILTNIPSLDVCCVSQIEESYEDDADLEINLLREEHARLSATITTLVDELQPHAPPYELENVCDSIVSLPSSHNFFCASN